MVPRISPPLPSLILNTKLPSSEFALNVPELINCDATVSNMPATVTGPPPPPPEPPPLLPTKPPMYCEAFAISIEPASHVNVPSWFQVTDCKLSASFPIGELSTILSSPVVVKTKPPGVPIEASRLEAIIPPPYTLRFSVLMESMLPNSPNSLGADRPIPSIESTSICAP